MQFQMDVSGNVLELKHYCIENTTQSYILVVGFMKCTSPLACCKGVLYPLKGQ